MRLRCASWRATPLPRPNALPGLRNRPLALARFGSAKIRVVPKYRDSISALRPYEVGRSIEDVAREHGLDPESIIKLTANESPEGPFPGVIEAAVETLASANRYPDNDLWDLSHALAEELGVEADNLLFGNGSVALLADITNAVGGPGTNVVYGWPSFIMYRFAAIWSGTGYVEVPLDDAFSLDLDAIGAAIDGSTLTVAGSERVSVIRTS